METKVLTPKARKLFPKLSNFKDVFYLAGGTGLALQIKHRVSVDFDLFSESPIKKTLLKKVEEVFADEPRQILVSDAGELTLMIGGVKFTFLHYPFRVLLPLDKARPVPVLSTKEILVGKAYTIGRRGELKDYVDLYVGIKNGYASLVEIIELANKKYGGGVSDRLFFAQPVYFHDVEEVQITMIHGTTPTKPDLAKFFSGVIRDSNLL